MNLDNIEKPTFTETISDDDLIAHYWREKYINEKASLVHKIIIKVLFVLAVMFGIMLFMVLRVVL